MVDLEWEPRTGPRTPSLCGRPTAAGTPCTLPAGRIPCRYHATDDERREYAAFVAAALEESGRNPRFATDDEVARRPPRPRRPRPADPFQPACHQWPAPEAGTTVYEWQEQHCAICGTWGASVEDHCHWTGLFRGYLCQGCNISEGKRGDAPFWKYRERPPAVIVGETSVYFGGWENRNGAEPLKWVIDFLGPRPADPFLQVFYLASAARLRAPQRWSTGR